MVFYDDGMKSKEREWEVFYEDGKKPVLFKSGTRSAILLPYK